MPANEREAAAFAVSEVFEKLSIEDQLFDTDLDATRLELVARPYSREIISRLDERVEALARLLLRESCNYAVVLAGKMPNFHVSATREILKRHRELSEELEKVLEVLDTMRNQTSDREAHDSQNFELQYRRALVQRLDRMEMFGLRIIGAGAREYPSTTAYVTLTATSAGTREPKRVDTALADQRRVFIRGEAGSGKSTLLQWLAVRAASRDFEEPLASWNERIPIYIRLRDYAKGELPGPERYIEGTTRNLLALMPDHWCHQILPRALVLVDGIDELPANRRRDFVTWLRELVTDFPGALLVVSSRPAALDAKLPIAVGEELGLRGFTSLALEPMTLADSEALTVQWHAAVARDRPQDADRLRSYERELRQAVRDRPPIRNLASNPLLCAMICALNWDRKQRLPDDRMELYRLSLEMLLERRDEERDIEPARLDQLSRSDKEELLDDLAYWILRNGYNEASQDRVEAQIGRIIVRFPQVRSTPSEILQELLERSGILRQPQFGTVDFIHRTFLEYMAARAAIAAGDIGVLVESTTDENWRETIVFAAGHARGRTRTDLINEILRKPWFRTQPLEARVTAACCLETVGRNLEPELLSRLGELAGGLFPPINTETARILAPAAAMEPRLLAGHEAAGEDAVAACIRTAAIVGGARMLDIIESYASFPGKPVDVAIVHAWTAFDLQQYLNKIISKRRLMFDFDMTLIDQEKLECLAMLVAYDNSDYDLVAQRFEQFRNSGSIDLVSNRAEAKAGTLFRSFFFLPEQRKRSHFRRADAERLRKLTSLVELRVDEIDPECIDYLTAMPNLKRLSFSLGETANLSPLSRLTNLEQVSLSGRVISDIRPIADCHKLRELGLL
jgi:hypothetical protein